MKPEEFEKLQLEKLSKIKDWNKDWPTSNRMAPTLCVDCNRKLEKPKSKGKLLIKSCKEFPNGLVSSTETEIRIDCPCGVCYIWSYPNIYLKTHRILELLMYQFKSGELLIPIPIK